MKKRSIKLSIISWCFEWQVVMCARTNKRQRSNYILVYLLSLSSTLFFFFFFFLSFICVPFFSFFLSFFLSFFHIYLSLSLSLSLSLTLFHFRTFHGLHSHRFLKSLIVILKGNTWRVTDEQTPNVIHALPMNIKATRPSHPFLGASPMTGDNWDLVMACTWGLVMLGMVGCVHVVVVMMVVMLFI